MNATHLTHNYLGMRERLSKLTHHSPETDFRSRPTFQEVFSNFQSRPTFEGGFLVLGVWSGSDFLRTA